MKLKFNLKILYVGIIALVMNTNDCCYAMGGMDKGEEMKRKNPPTVTVKAILEKADEIEGSFPQGYSVLREGKETKTELEESRTLFHAGVEHRMAEEMADEDCCCCYGPHSMIAEIVRAENKGADKKGCHNGEGCRCGCFIPDKQCCCRGWHSRGYYLNIASKVFTGMGACCMVVGTALAGFDAFWSPFEQEVALCSKSLQDCANGSNVGYCARIDSTCKNLESRTINGINASYHMSIASAVLNAVGPALCGLGKFLQVGAGTSENESSPAVPAQKNTDDDEMNGDTTQQSAQHEEGEASSTASSK